MAGSRWRVGSPATRYSLPAESCVSVGVQRKEVVFSEAILPPAKLADDFGSLLTDHLAQLVGREERQRREGAFGTAGARVAERNIEAGIDLLVAATVEHSGHNLFDSHFVEKSAQRGSLFDALLHAIDRLGAGVRETLDHDA